MIQLLSARSLKKLSAYAEGREVTREDIDLLCIRRIESDGYSLAINILRGNAAMVFTRLRELDVQNYEPYAIIGIIGFSLADIYRAKLDVPLAGALQTWLKIFPMRRTESLQ